MPLEVTVPTTGTIRTMDVLRSLGFQTDTTVITDDGPGLSANFGGLTLTAGAYRKLLAEIVMITGALATSRSLAHIHFDMPRYVESGHFVTAWIVWHLDQHSEFRKVQNLPWVEEGRNHQGLLPWVRSMAEWEARPQCTVRRDWLRLALKTMAEHIVTLPDDTGVVFSFDGSVLSIKCDGKVIALAGEGVPWAVSFKVQAGALRRLPKRLTSEDIGISIWESRISIGSHTYPGTLDGLGTARPERVQEVEDQLGVETEQAPKTPKPTATIAKSERTQTMEADEKALTDFESRTEAFLEARCLRRQRALSDDLEVQAS